MLLDRATLASALNRSDIGSNTTAYPDAYIASVIADVQSDLSGYLGYDPVLQVVTNEEGIVSYVQSGSYVGRYFFRTRVAPFIPGLPSSIFSSLQLRYGISTLPDSAVDLASVTVMHSTGQAFTLAPGAVEALTWQYGLSPGVQAVAFLASYVAGYATGINDPVPMGGGSYNAAPMPAGITQAAVLLCRERIAMDDAANQDTTNTMAGAISSIKTADQSIAFGTGKGATRAPLGPALGYGTPLSLAAAARLDQWRIPMVALFM